MLRRAGLFLCTCILTSVALSVDSYAAAKPNIVLITLGSARPDRMGFLGSRTSLTPGLDRFAHEGTIFAQAYSQSPSTVVSAATVLTGTYPQITRAGELGIPLPPSLPYLPELLRQAGYKTAAFVGSIQLDPKGGPFQRYDFGFSLYDAGFHEPRRGESRYLSTSRHADDVVVRAMKWIAANKSSSFFVWIHLDDADGVTGPSYDHEIAASDAAILKLFGSLRAYSLHDDALLIVTALHGESLGAHGEDQHGLFLYDETIHVPILLKLPGKQMPGRQVKTRVRLVDVAPTILESAAIPVPSQMLGQSLRRIAQSTSQADQPAYSRSDMPHWAFACSAIESWRAGKYLYIRSPKPELYDLTSDPGATKNLAQSSKATLDTMAAQLQAFDSRLGNEAGKEPASTLTSSEMQKLASLGYIGLQKSAAGVNAGTEGNDPKEVVSSANKTLAALRDLDDGKPEPALSALKTAANAQPTYLAQFAMGAALFQQQNFSEAIPYLHKAIELQPDSPWAHYTMGLSLMKTGDFKTAAVHLEIASQRLPSFSAAHSVLAEVYQHLGRSQDAARERSATSQGQPPK